MTRLYRPAPLETRVCSIGAFILLGIAARQLQKCKLFLRIYT